MTEYHSPILRFRGELEDSRPGVLNGDMDRMKRDPGLKEPYPRTSKRKRRLASLVFRFRRIRKKRFKLLGVVMLALVAVFDYYAWRHLVYGELSLGLWIGFGMLAFLSIPVTFFGLIIAVVLLS